MAEALARVAAISAASWAEVLSHLAELEQDPDVVAEALEQQGPLGIALVVHPFDEDLARRVARLRRLPRAAGLSLGDRACLALGEALGLPVITADRVWATLALGVTVQAIR